MATVLPLTGELQIVTFIGLELKGYAPSIVVTDIQVMSKGSISFTGAAPTAEISVTEETPGATPLIFAGKTPSVEITHTRQMPAATALAISTSTPVTSILIDVPSGSLSISGKAPKVSTLIDVGLGGIAFSGKTPAVSLSDHVSLLPSTGALGFVTASPLVNITHNRAMPLGTLALTGAVPGTNITIPVLPLLETLAFTTSTPTISIDFVGGSVKDGTLILNADATTENPNNYEQCDYTGFRVMPGSLKLTWNKYAVRKKSWESRHPQEFQKDPSNTRQKGSRRPEQEDVFLDDNEITQDDL